MKKFDEAPALRPATAKLVARIISPFMDYGVVTAAEYDVIGKALRSLAKNGSETIQHGPLRLLDTDAAAKLLGVCPSQFRALEAAGQFPFARKLVGHRAVRYRSNDLEDYIMAGNTDKEDKREQA